MKHVEETYYQHGDVLVTSARVAFGQKTYALANISSVSMVSESPSVTPVFVLVLVGLIIGLCAASMDALVVGLALGGLFIGLGIVCALTGKTKYTVRVSSASGEANAAASTNKDGVQAIVDAINEAIVQRG